jgi:hypothetical protein
LVVLELVRLPRAAAAEELSGWDGAREVRLRWSPRRALYWVGGADSSCVPGSVDRFVSMDSPHCLRTFLSGSMTMIHNLGEKMHTSATFADIEIEMHNVVV